MLKKNISNKKAHIDYRMNAGAGILLVKDIWNAYGETLLDLIKDAMRNNDFDLVLGYSHLMFRFGLDFMA